MPHIQTVCASNPTTMEHKFQSPPVLLRADLSACFGTHTEVLIVRVCCPVESMQYIFPMHFQKNESKSSSNPQLSREVTTASLRWSPCVRSESPSVHLKRAGRVETSQYSRLHILYRHQATTRFFFYVFENKGHIFFFFRKTVKFLSSPSQKELFCALMLVSVLYIPGQPTYIVVVLMECSDFSLHHDTV